ncbi:SDR family NAD(P)-dependent oxidoreductase [Pseudofrankia inefficax]|uniref:Short-chain dehydrogenase/reductase SDR n=1 Tax=Pseudofrankia inefficax (strain DSM 45817 / CECT 9037 / DDB 130130 / EuI1c) TaxID=298654 RepID=E3IU50_PSEI1|nr:SDR family oxidoreductase [Pseudofrankia inefficax]ADP81243.1 short-chain dehydrogenase/reductase SDR [Pseudofrankia inefficax]
MSDELAGKVAVITGATRGLGRAMAFAFAEAGATVVVASRKADACDGVAAEITAATGRAALPVPCHVGHWPACQALVETVVDRLGHLDVLVNNAGMSPLYPSLPEVTEDLYDKVLAVNLKGPFRLSVLAAEHMAGLPDGGSIVSVSSIAAGRPKAHELPYGIAKAGLHALSTGIAHAYGPKVRANVIMAGPFLTDVARSWDMAAFTERAQREIPLQRAGRPEEIVGAALYLAGPASSFTSGAVLKVDGGLLWSPS